MEQWSNRGASASIEANQEANVWPG